MRRLSRALVALPVAGVAALGPAVAALAAGSGSITTTPAVEAWYRSAPVCVLPTGCPAEPPSPYAADTLHVGVNLGQEEARTVLRLDLGELPPGTKPAGGQLRLPLATGGQDGTRNAETASLRACLVDAEVEEADGAFTGAPEVDCETAGVEAVHVPAAGEVPAAFTVDLTELAEAWQSATVPGGLALVPGEETAPGDTWHVAFSQQDREGEGLPKVTAAVSFVGTAVNTTEEPPAPVQAPIDLGGPAVLDAPGFDLSAPAPAIEAPLALPETQPQPAGPAPQAAPPQVAVQPVASVLDGSFRYPAVFLLPLLFAAAVAWLGRALTRDLAVDD